MIYREAGQYKTSYEADQQLFPILQDKVFVLLVLAFAFGAVPFLASEYLFRAILVPFLILALAAIGLNILVGFCGQVSLGTGGFMAVGAYAAYNLAVRMPDLNLLVVFLLAGAAATVVGVLFGLPSLRIKGFYLAVATLAAQFFLDWAFARIGWFTNYAPSGSVTAPALTIFGYTFDSPVREVPARAGDRVRLRAGRPQPHARGDRALVDGHARHGRRRRGDRHPAPVREGHRLRGELVLRRAGRRPVGVRLPRRVGAARLRREPLLPAALHGDHRRPGLDPRLLPGRGLHRDPAARAEPAARAGSGIELSTALISHIEFMIFGALIIFFLIVEPHGLARLWAIGKEKLRLWPFPH